MFFNFFVSSDDGGKVSTLTELSHNVVELSSFVGVVTLDNIRVRKVLMNLNLVFKEFKATAFEFL